MITRGAPARTISPIARVNSIASAPPSTSPVRATTTGSESSILNVIAKHPRFQGQLLTDYSAGAFTRSALPDPALLRVPALRLRLRPVPCGPQSDPTATGN